MDDQDRKIEWHYFVSLEKSNREDGFIFVSKLSRKHIEYQQRKMKANIAVRTLSSSVADSMEYLLKNMESPHTKNAAQFAVS